MRRVMFFGCIFVVALMYAGSCFAQAQGTDWKDGGPKYIYVKPKTDKPPRLHMPYDEKMKCVDCHKWDGVDAYTAATMTLKKSKTGRLPREEIKKAILDTLKGLGNYREMYVLATSFNNKPLATCMEYTIDPKTLTFYGSSEKQGEKLFHMAANSNVSLVYVKHRDDKDYFKDPVGVQIVGKAQQLKVGDPEFDEAFNVGISTVIMPEGMKLTPEMIKYLKKNQLVTKITPERIIITHHEFRAKGHHFKQIWEAGGK
jgi:hypothetical protein